MKFNHTWGKWIVRKYDILAIFDWGPQAVACAYQNPHDAHLIAAAPDMLKAIIESSKYLFKNEKNFIGHKSALHRMINDTIERATGMKIEEILEN